MLRVEAADCGEVILAAEDAHRAGRGQVRSQRQRDDCRRGRSAAIQRRDGRACRVTRAGRPEERDIPSEEARHGTTLVAEALRASVGSTRSTYEICLWLDATLCVCHLRLVNGYVPRIAIDDDSRSKGERIGILQWMFRDLDDTAPMSAAQLNRLIPSMD